MNTGNLSFDTNEGKILLAGDVRRVFPDAEGLGCEIHVNILDAIEAAARVRFSSIGVVMPAASEQLIAALRAFRKVNRGARIVLLAQMWQEPAAIDLVGTASNGQRLADDYLICPVQLCSFRAAMERYFRSGPDEEEQKKEPVPVIAIDTKTEERIRELEKLATTDELTGLKNRRYIWEFGRQIIKLAERESRQVTLLIFDIDNFKHYNDVYGHLAGDQILKQAAVLMRRCCRLHDVVGRVGGDEFAVVFWDGPESKSEGDDAERRSAAEHPDEVIFIAQRFIKELNKAEFALLGPEGKGVLSISGGLASFPRNGETIEQLFTQADKALLEAKHSGKNRIYLVGRPKNNIADIE